jgi:hypothetical protein
MPSSLMMYRYTSGFLTFQQITVRSLLDTARTAPHHMPEHYNQCFFFFLGGRRGTRAPKHVVNRTGESKNFKMLEFPLNQLQIYYGYLCDLCPLTAFIFF